jgi:hypothetical protein
MLRSMRPNSLSISSNVLIGIFLKGSILLPLFHAGFNKFAGFYQYYTEKL